MNIRTHLYNSRYLDSTLFINTNEEFINCDNYEKYIQLHIFYPIKDITIDLSKFINLKILYLYSPININIINIPNSLEYLYFTLINDNVNIEYSFSIKNIINLSSMGENFIDFTNIYHKYKLHNYNYRPLIEYISSKCFSQLTDYNLLEKKYLELLN